MLKKILPFLPLILGLLMFFVSGLVLQFDTRIVGNSMTDWQERQRHYSYAAEIASTIQQIGTVIFLAGLVLLAINPPKFATPQTTPQRHFPTVKHCLLVLVFSVIGLIWTFALATSGPDAASQSFRAEAMPWDNMHRDWIIFSLLAVAFVSAARVLIAGPGGQRIRTIILLLFPAYILLAYLLWALNKTYGWRWTHILRNYF